MSSASCLVNFEEVCKPKSQGGLGILHLGNIRICPISAEEF